MNERERASGYFGASGGTPDPAFPPQLLGADELPEIRMAPGLTGHPAWGRAAMLNIVRFEPHSEAPLHTHAEEQLGTVLEGELEFELAGETRTMRPGDVWVVPPHAPHAARTEDAPCVALDVFSPPREGFRALLERPDDRVQPE